jgi:hypothetical protein
VANIYKIFYFLTLTLGLFACDDPHEHPVNLAPFRVISANGLVTFKFVQGAGDNVAVSTSMLDNTYSVSGGVLSVNGIGTMTIAMGNYMYLNCNACDVKSSGPLFTDTLAMYIHAGSARFSNLLVSSIFQLDAINTGTYKFSGSAPFFHVTCNNLAGIEAYDLVTDSTYVTTTCAVDTKVHATKVINVFINSIGNVDYKGDPPIVRATITGSGRLVKK